MSEAATIESRASGAARLRRASGWARANLFSSIGNTLVTLALALLALRLFAGFVDWAIIRAVWVAPNMRACQAANGGDGACWAFIREKWRFILFGRYPYEEQWRAALTAAILFLVTGLSFVPRFWRRELVYLWIAGVTASLVLMFGGVLGLPFVATDVWSGLPLTMILALFSMILGFPLAVLLALGGGRICRRSRSSASSPSSSCAACRSSPCSTWLR